MSYHEVGLIAKTPATFDDTGEQLTAPVYHDGWHVNTLEPTPEWETHKIPTPATPTCIYAGGIMPVCYVFESKEAFRALLPEDENDAP